MALFLKYTVMETKNLYLKERKEVARFMRRLYKKGLTTSLGGNISKRVGDHFLITPSEVDKGTLKAKNIVILDQEGNNLTQWISPSRETSMHLQIYKDHPTINAIVHCHTIFASAFFCHGYTNKCPFDSRVQNDYKRPGDCTIRTYWNS